MLTSSDRQSLKYFVLLVDMSECFLNVCLFSDSEKVSWTKKVNSYVSVVTNQLQKENIYYQLYLHACRWQPVTIGGLLKKKRKESSETFSWSSNFNVEFQNKSLNECEYFQLRSLSSKKKESGKVSYLHTVYINLNRHEFILFGTNLCHFGVNQYQSGMKSHHQTMESRVKNVCQKFSEPLDDGM